MMEATGSMETFLATTSPGLEEYEQRIGPARERLAGSAAVLALQSTADPAFLHAFLLHFCSLGARMTEPVEKWIRRAAERCHDVGLATMSRFLAAHARAETGHHLMMIADVRALADLWNKHYQPSVDANHLLSQVPTPGVENYCGIHNESLLGDTPYGQIAIEYEIEMLPLRFGQAFIARCVELLGPDILSRLSFVTSHIELDVAHTKSNAWALSKVSAEVPGSVPALAAAGTAILDAYGEFLNDCVRLAERDARKARNLAAPPADASALNWRLHLPIWTRWNNGEDVPSWLKEVRALRGFVLYDNGTRPGFKGESGSYLDDDPIDLHAYHILAYRGSRLVGCSRVYHLVSGPPCLAEAVLGTQRFSTMLQMFGVERANAVEIGRWIVHPAYRECGRPAVQLAAGAAAVAVRLGNSSVVRRALVVCSVGMRDRQDLMLRRLGMINAPDCDPVESDTYGDLMQVLYCTNPKRLDRRFYLLMDQMVETLRLRLLIGSESTVAHCDATNAQAPKQPVGAVSVKRKCSD